MKQKYQDLRLGAKTLENIDAANAVITEYQNLGYNLTLRQVYYQMVARGMIPNDKQSYKRLGEAIGKGRLAGLLDWEAIVDRTRAVRELTYWNTPQRIINAMAPSYRIDKWVNQQYAPQVWIEKDALVGIIQRPCERLEVPYLALRGYPSLTTIRERALKIASQIRDGKIPYIIHLGDHDPSGMDMSRDLQDRLNMFLEGEGYGESDWEFIRLALNMDQVRLYNPPPFFAKITDSRSGDYIAQYGNDSWELDALDPTTIDTLISDQIATLVDDTTWQPLADKEANEREVLKNVASYYPQVETFVQSLVDSDGQS